MSNIYTVVGEAKDETNNPDYANLINSPQGDYTSTLFVIELNYDSNIGTLFLLHTDRTVANEDMAIGFPEINGFAPDQIIPRVLNDLIGSQEMILKDDPESIAKFAEYVSELRTNQ